MLSKTSFHRHWANRKEFGLFFLISNGRRVVGGSLVSLFLLIAVHALADTVVKPVKLIKVETNQGAVERTFFGQIVAKQTVDLAFQVGGQIIKFPVVEGETIKKGELIAELDLETFKLALDQARLQKEEADRTVARYNKLSESTVSSVKIEEAVTQANLAEIAVRKAEYSLRQATLTAPFDALVATRNVANFSTISSGTPVVRVHDMSELRIEIDVPEILMQRAGRDPDAIFTAKFEMSEKDFPLVVREFNAETSSVSQSFRITFGLAPPKGLNILPGSSVTVVVKIRSDATSVIIPTSAVAIGANGDVSVLVFEPGEGDTGTLRRVKVEIEPTSNGGFRVVSGLAKGVEIVAAGASALEDSQQVRRFTAFRN